MEYDEVRWVKDFMPKLPELYDPNLVQLIVHLTRFCTLTLESKRKDLRKDRRKSVIKNREVYKKIIIEVTICMPMLVYTMRHINISAN